MSLAVIGDAFYIGMGDGNTASTKNGALLLVELPIELPEEETDA